jgi:hypothetical protein
MDIQNMKNLLGRIMLNTTPEEQQRIKDIRDSLTKLSSATAKNLVYVIKLFLDLLENPKNKDILNHRDLYPYFAALIKDHSAILKGLGLIDAELFFQGGSTPLVELMGIYKLALFTFNNVQLEQPLENCLNDYSFSAQHGNLHAATALIQYYFRELAQMSESNFKSFVNEINESVFSNPTALQASGFFLSAQLYYQISQQYLQKDNTDNAFKYFQKAILHYITARYLLRVGHGQESMPLDVTEKIYPGVEDEEKVSPYITEKVVLFKDKSTVFLNRNAVAREASLKAKSCAREYDARIGLAAGPLNIEELDKTIQKILNELRPISAISYPGAYFSPASDDARAGPSDAAAIPGLKQW